VRPLSILLLDAEAATRHDFLWLVPLPETSTPKPHSDESPMREFFHGWRRKMGCVTLVMALVLMVGWIRSHFFHDGMTLRMNSHVSHLHCWMVSRLDTLHLVIRRFTTWEETGEPFIEYFSKPCPEEVRFITQTSAIRWHWQGAGFGFGDLSRPEGDFTIWTFPYWLPTGTLTIISAWLLLSKPRPRPQPTPEPTPDHA
jgi:hypothetical protein